MVKFKKNIIIILLAVGTISAICGIGYITKTSLSKNEVDKNEEYAFQEIRDELLNEKFYLNKLNAEKRKEELKNKKPTEEVIIEEVVEEPYEEEVYEEVVANPEPVVEEVYEEVAPAPPVAVAPPVQTYTPYSIGINGDYRSFVELGYTRDRDNIQSYLDAGNLVASLTPFLPNDGQTTYFTGHNPGIFNFMANAIYDGAIITVVDGNGNPYNYRITDYTYVDINGQAVLGSIGKTVLDCYNYGSGEESIIIQYCLPGTMIAWYGTII